MAWRVLQAYVRNHIRLGEEFAAWVSERPDLFVIVSGPAFAMTVLRLNPQVLNGSAGSRAAMLGDATTEDAYGILVEMAQTLGKDKKRYLGTVKP